MGPKMPKWGRNESKMGPNWVQNGSEMGPKWVKNGKDAKDACGSEQKQSVASWLVHLLASFGFGLLRFVEVSWLISASWLLVVTFEAPFWRYGPFS